MRLHPESVIERAVARPFIGPSVVLELQRAGWHLVHVETEVTEGELGVHHVETTRVTVDQEVLSNTFAVSEQRLDHHPSPEEYLDWERRHAWTKLGEALGERLGVLHARTH